MDLNTQIALPAYDFLREDPRLKGRIILLGLSGSYGYGTQREGSDIDFRGIALNRASDLLGLSQFEQFEDRKTDTVIYSFNKILRLFLDCNPSTIELLGLEKESYAILTPAGQELIDHRRLFLSKRAAASFGHYAQGQLRRMKNAQARDVVSAAEREAHILQSVENALRDFEKRHRDREKGSVKLYIDKAEQENLDTEIFLDASLRHLPLRSYVELVNTMGAVVRSYDKAGKREEPRDELHLKKMGLHIIRLYMEAVDILGEGLIRTRRPKDELEILCSIRDGFYMKNGLVTDDFYKLAADYEARFLEAAKRSDLPETADLAAVGTLAERINRLAIEEEK